MIRGASFIEDFPYIKLKKGQNGLNELETVMHKNGSTIKLSGIKDMHWYPVEERVIFLNSLKEAFSWDDSAIYDMGKNAPKINTAMKLFLKYLVSPNTAFKSVSN